MLSSDHPSIVINPPGTCRPRSRLERALAQGEGHPGYFKRNGFKLIDTGYGGGRDNPRQSALGKYKFDFDERYSGLSPRHAVAGRFAASIASQAMAASASKKPADLAGLLLKGSRTGRPKDRGRGKAGKTTRASAWRDPMSVYLLYWTAFAGANGQMDFRDDPYGWDRTLAGKIEARSAHPTITLGDVLS